MASRKIEYELKNNIFRQYGKTILTQYKSTTVGDLLNRLSEDVVAKNVSRSPSYVCYQPSDTTHYHKRVYVPNQSTNDSWTLLPLPILSFTIYKVSSIINKV
ncbi:hypothetical protein INT81_09665 [Riemerella anatipestifer]|nr:hypothetical protein [Riemerella anatipestifer]